MYAAIVVATSFADVAADASSSWTLGSFGWISAMRRYCSTACADAVWISEFAAEILVP